jgi:hypothetical protein
MEGNAMHATAPLASVVWIFAATAVGQTQQWVQVATAGPSSRENFGMAYDTSRQRTVLFGGELLTGLAGDTWEWDGASWTHVAVPGPSARQGLAVAYDSNRQRTVLFGGLDGAYRADTWEWDGATWVPQILAAGPGPRANHAMAYDSQRGRVVLFGGQMPATTGGGHAWLSDTWEWNGTTWTQASAAGPIGRGFHAMAYDSLRGRTVLFGGARAPAGLSIYLDDTWEWDGSAWLQVATGGPPGRASHAMCHDAQRGAVLIHGGNGIGGGSLGTWSWDGTQWTSGPSQGPLCEGGEMAYDSARQRTVLFVGESSGSGTWELVSTGPSATPFGAGCGSPALALAGLPTAPPAIGTTAGAAVTSAPSPFAFVALGVSDTTFGPFSLPVSLASIGMHGCSLLHSAEVIGEPTTPTGAGTASYTFAIPNNASLVGFHVYLQAWAWAPGANAVNVIVSNGLDWTLAY